MPGIADQVETLEHDHVAALAQIDALTATNAIFASNNMTLALENESLRDQVDDMQQYVDSTRSMAEQIASSTLDMLRASRRPVGPSAEVIPLVPKPVVMRRRRARDLTDGQLSDHVADVAIGAGYLLTPTEKKDVIAAVKDANFPITQSDSGDEQPSREAAVERLAALAGTDIDGAILPPTQDGINRSNNPAWVTTVPPINELRSPVLIGPMTVEHDKNDLPIFLTRDMPFGPRAQVFS